MRSGKDTTISFARYLSGSIDTKFDRSLKELSKHLSRNHFRKNYIPLCSCWVDFAGAQ